MPSFHKILDLCSSLSQNLHDLVFIGGVAVYLHALAQASKNVTPEASHDADLMISFSDYGVLKDEAEITHNRRLAKHQMIVDDIELDVYVEHLNNLIVPYDEVFMHSLEVEGIRVACLEHLLVLKLEAFKTRGSSGKGEKDRRDVAKIGLLLGRRADLDLITPYLRSELAMLLKTIAKSSVFFELCAHNAHAAKKARSSFETFVASVV
jgi:hypothetical protein